MCVCVCVCVCVTKTNQYAMDIKALWKGSFNEDLTFI